MINTKSIRLKKKGVYYQIKLINIERQSEIHCLVYTEYESARLEVPKLIYPRRTTPRI